MGELEKTIDLLCREPAECFYEKMEKLHKNSVSTDEADYARETFKRIFSKTKKCFYDYMDKYANEIELEKLNYFGFDPEDLENIFYEMEPNKFSELCTPESLKNNFSYIKKFIEEVPEDIDSLDEHLYEMCLTQENSNYDNKDLRDELQLIHTKIKNLYDNVSSLYQTLSNEDKLIQQYYDTINEIGKEEFKNKVLNYLKNEYGYDELADKLIEEDSFEKISKKLRKPKIDDLPIAGPYKDVKKIIEEENPSTTQILQLHKLESMRNEMEIELENFANYFKPDLDHYKELKDSCEKILNKIEEYYLEEL